MEELLFVLVGGIIGLSGGVLTTILTYKLKKSESRRQELINSYISWSDCVYEALEEWIMLKTYDNVNILKEHYSELEKVSYDPGGRSREELANSWRVAYRKLWKAVAKILLLEPHDRYIQRMKEISEITVTLVDNPLEIFSFKESIIRDVEQFMKELRKSHPIISK